MSFMIDHWMLEIGALELSIVLERSGRNLFGFFRTFVGFLLSQRRAEVDGLSNI